MVHQLPGVTALSYVVDHSGSGVGILVLNDSHFKAAVVRYKTFENS